MTPNSWINFMAKTYDTEYPDRVGTNEIGKIFSYVTLLLSLHIFQSLYKGGLFLDENKNLDHSDISKYVMKNYMEYKKESPDNSCTDRPCIGHYAYRTVEDGVNINPFLEFAILKELRNDNGSIVREIKEFTQHPYRNRPIEDDDYFHKDIQGNSQPLVFASNSSIFRFLMCYTDQ